MAANLTQAAFFAAGIALAAVAGGLAPEGNAHAHSAALCLSGFCIGVVACANVRRAFAGPDRCTHAVVRPGGYDGTVSVCRRCGKVFTNIE